MPTTPRKKFLDILRVDSFGGSDLYQLWLSHQNKFANDFFVLWGVGFLLCNNVALDNVGKMRKDNFLLSTPCFYFERGRRR